MPNDTKRLQKFLELGFLEDGSFARKGTSTVNFSLRITEALNNALKDFATVLDTKKEKLARQMLIECLIASRDAEQE